MPKPIKITLAVLIGFVVWFVFATLANLVVRASLPGYVAAEPAAEFTLPMLVARLAVGGLSSLAAGFASASIARASLAATRILAVALVLFFLPVHYALWAQFPFWYHAVFLLSIAPLVLTGAWALRARGVNGSA